MWTKQILMTDGFPVKVYVNASNTECVVFPLFGRYYRLASENALDFATTFIVAKHNNVVTFASYQHSSEDTVNLHIDQIAS